MPDLETIARKQAELIRKVGAASVFIGDASLSVPTAFTTGGVAEIQTVTITGTPTGGNFTLTYSGQTTAPIVWNATAAAVRTALEALSAIGTGGVTTAGGPLPGTPVTVNFVNAPIGDVPQMTATASLTGGTTPTVTVTTSTPGTAVDLAALPAGYEDVGLVTKDDAYTWSRETETAETRSHGVVDPTRRDIISTMSSLAFSAQETKRSVLSLYYNVDLAAVTATAPTGEYAFSEALAPSTRYYRVITIGRDGIGKDAIYIIRIMPRAMVSETGDQNWSDENELVYGMTLTATPDSTLGYSMRHVFGGPGWRSMLTRMGINSA